MQSPLVVFMPEKEREPLRSSGVLPPSWFEECNRSLWDGAGDRVYFWPQMPDYETAKAGRGGNPPPPAQLLGLETKGDEWMRSENLVAKLFGATVLHVLFLDDEVDGTSGLADMAPVLKLVQWVRSLGDSIRTWFADTQNRNIRHVAVVVARRGPFHLTEDQLAVFRKEFGEEGSAVKTCYLVSSRLEVGLGHDALHAQYVWPIIVGRLLLRMLIELSQKDASNGIFLPGVHLVRSFEYLINCPAEEIEGLKEESLQSVYRVINHESTAIAADDGGGTLRPQVTNREIGVFPELSSNLVEPGNSVDLVNSTSDWHRVPVMEMINETNRDSRWNVARKRARDNFAACERKHFLEKEQDRVIEARAIFGRVAKNPGNIRNEERILQEKLPADTYGSDIIYEKWRTMVQAEKRRKDAQKRLEEAGREMVRAQNHYVTAPYGILAVMAASLFCGFALVRILWAAGGNGGLLVAIVLSSLSALGAFSAWLVTAWFHCRAGRKAMGELKDLVYDVDAKMNERHAAAVQAIRTAETRHRIGLRRNATFVLQRLLERVDRIVDRELLQSPTSDVFYLGEKNEAVDAVHASPSQDKEDMSEEIAVFRGRTRFSHKLGRRAPNVNGQKSFNVSKVIAEAFQKSGEKSFQSFWERLCDETDGSNRQGNFPAQIFVPRIRDWFRNFGGRLVMAQKLDLIASAEGGSSDTQPVEVLPKEFDDLRGDTGFALASMDVESEAVGDAPRMVFVPKAAAIYNQANRRLEGGGGDGIVVCETPVLDGLPQAAFFFQDIRVHGIGRDDKTGRLLFLSRNGKPVQSHSESGVA